MPSPLTPAATERGVTIAKTSEKTILFFINCPLVETIVKAKRRRAGHVMWY